MLALCMIVKNEEALIGRVLESMISYVDEVNIVDANSTDRTYEIIKSFPDVKVQQIAMPNDFAVQRNRSLEMATTDWCLVQDTDENFQQVILDSLRIWIKYGEENNIDSFSFYRQSIIDGVLMDPFKEDHQTRLFRKGLRYQSNNGIHEYLVGCKATINVNAWIIHNKSILMQRIDNQLYEKYYSGEIKCNQ